MEQCDRKKIRDAIRAKYKTVARSAEGVFPYATGADGARALGYDPSVVAAAPKDLIRSFCGVGNPFALGEIPRGGTVLDIGCGVGFDLYMAAGRVGAQGKVHGVDLTAEMVRAATENMARLGLSNVEVRQGASEALPFDSETMDTVLSNGVLNLSPDKERSFQEIFRVLKPGGRLQFADVVLDDTLPADVVGSLEAWSD